jgi:hypothetical protein
MVLEHIQTIKLMQNRWLSCNLLIMHSHATEPYNLWQQCTDVKCVNTRHTQKNGAVSTVNTVEITPFFCVCPVYTHDTK